MQNLLLLGTIIESTNRNRVMMRFLKEKKQIKKDIVAVVILLSKQVKNIQLKMFQSKIKQ